MRRFLSFGWLVPLAMVTGVGCGKSSGGGAADGATDGVREGAAPSCPGIDAAAATTGDGGGAITRTDDLGPNAPATKAASSLGRVNIYEVTSPSVLQRVDVYLRADLEQTRLTIAIQEATARTAPFTKLMDVQIDVGTCEGWASTGAISIPLAVGRFYAIGFDPNQPVTAFVSADAETLPIDSAFGRLVGSKTATSVSIPNLTWDKLSEKEYNRQRLLTSPRPGGSPFDGGATDSSDASDAPGDGVTDTTRTGG
jgi:hypothetical protein